MADEKTKPKTYTEEEHKKEITRILNEARHKEYSFDVKFGTTRDAGSGVYPFVNLAISGGNYSALRELYLDLYKTVINFIDKNPPSNSEENTK